MESCMFGHFVLMIRLRVGSSSIYFLSQYWSEDRTDGILYSNNPRRTSLVDSRLHHLLRYVHGISLLVSSRWEEILRSRSYVRPQHRKDPVNPSWACELSICGMSAIGCLASMTNRSSHPISFCQLHCGWCLHPRASKSRSWRLGEDRIMNAQGPPMGHKNSPSLKKQEW